MLAATKGHPAVVEVLLGGGATTEHKNNDGQQLHIKRE
jgi:hypothetical protein